MTRVVEGAKETAGDLRSASSMSGGAEQAQPGWKKRARGLGRKAARVIGLTAARAVGALCNGIALVLLARWVGPAEFGQFSVAMSILATVAGVLGFGLPVFALRAAVLGRVAATGYAFFLNLVSSFVAALIGFTIIMLTIHLPLWAAVLLATSMAVEKNADLRVGIGTEFGYAKIVNWTLTLRGLAVLGAVLAGYAIGADPLGAFIVGRLVVMSVAALILVGRVRGWPMVAKRPRDGSLEVMGNLAVENSIAATKLLDVTLVGAVAGPFAAGLYTGAQKLLTPIRLLTASLRVVVLGPIARGGAERARKVALACFAVSILAAVVLGIASIWSAELVVFILGPEYLAASSAFGWTLIGVPAIAVTPLIITILQDKGRASWVTWSTGVATAATLAGVTMGASVAGATGAAVALTGVAWLRMASLAAMSLTLGRPRGGVESR